MPLTVETALTYSYDSGGSLTSRGGTLFQSVLPAAVTSATYNLANRLTNWTSPAGNANPVCDANGNMTSDGTRTFIWDSRNRLVAISGTTVSFAYDAQSRRSLATRAGVATGYLYDGTDVVQELSGTTPTANLLTGLGIDQRFTRTVGSTPSTYLNDNLGSPVALADSAGVVQTSYAYDPYGVTATTGAANTNPYQYTGRENDGATGTISTGQSTKTPLYCLYLHAHAERDLSQGNCQVI